MPTVSQGVMNMAINIVAKTDYSMLFNSLGSSRSGSSSATNLNFLSDYAAIKNGSYGKLMRAYYAESGSSRSVSSIVNNKKNTAISEDDTKTLAAMQSTTDALKESADALLEDGKDSVFKTGDTEKIYKAVEEFVNDYNSVLDASDNVNSTSVLGKVSRMVSGTAAFEKSLASVGITINEDNSLSVNKETFLNADMEKVQDLFNKSGSFGYSTSAQASFINYAADNEASKANTYGANGSYTNNFNTGNIYSSWF